MSTATALSSCSLSLSNPGPLEVELLLIINQRKKNKTIHYFLFIIIINYVYYCQRKKRSGRKSATAENERPKFDPATPKPFHRSSPKFTQVINYSVGLPTNLLNSINIDKWHLFRACATLRIDFFTRLFLFIFCTCNRPQPASKNNNFWAHFRRDKLLSVNRSNTGHAHL